MKTKIYVECASLLALCCLVSVQAGEGFSFKDEPGQYLDVLRDSKLVGRYMYAYDKAKLTETYKTYLHVFDAAGGALITKGPGGEYTHHRGIFIGWNKLTVDGKSYDRWHMKGGEQIHEKYLAQTADKDQASFTSLVRWTGSGSDPILEEERTLTFRSGPAPAYALIDMTSKLKAVAGETMFNGDPEHAGLQFRPANEVDRKETVYVYPVENANAHKDRDYPWVGETYTLGGKKYSIVYLNHPSNPTGTAFSAYRNYGRFGGFFKTTIPKGGELVLRARFLVIEGEMPAADWIQKAANEFTGKSDTVPKVTIKPSEQPAPPKAKK